MVKFAVKILLFISVHHQIKKNKVQRCQWSTPITNLSPLQFFFFRILSCVSNTAVVIKCLSRTSANPWKRFIFDPRACPAKNLQHYRTRFWVDVRYTRPLPYIPNEMKIFSHPPFFFILDLRSFDLSSPRNIVCTGLWDSKKKEFASLAMLLLRRLRFN